MTRHKSSGGMGFRDFRDFNIAMLGKQGSRFASNPGSLVTRVYKARYFANSDFLNSELGHNPSFIWRSIHEAKKLIVNGVKWKIGAGTGISILGQPWLSDNANHYITTTSQSIVGKTIDSLWHVGSREWDLDIIKVIFNVRDQEAILNTVFNDNGEEDVNALCPVCHEDNESIIHSLVHCSYARLCWSLVNVDAQVGLYSDFKTWMGNVADAKKQAVNPQPNAVKVLVDAAVFEDKDAVGFGLIARDSEGALIQAKSIIRKNSVSPVLAEAMAIKEALSWIDEMHWQESTVVSDCLVVVQAIRSKTPMRSQFGSVIEECRSQLRRLNKVSLYHVKRSANMVAHQLARESYSYPDRSFNRDTIPVSVNSCIEMDLNK
ncbi:uncharacterized protein LOC141714488 [Apium graveolens]|uniref:uncharacterized protein LOC141714488 n=1 Tax=Apium graveolens TaxID=4045 RepID=UPI003D7ADD93